MKKLAKNVLNVQTLIYLIFGLMAGGVNLLAYYVLLHFNVDYKIAEILAWIISMIFSFLTNKRIVFKSKGRPARVVVKEVTTFFTTRIFSFILEFLILTSLVDGLGWDERWTKPIVSFLIGVLNYAFSKLLIFRNKEIPENADAEIELPEEDL